MRIASPKQNRKMSPDLPTQLSAHVDNVPLALKGQHVNHKRTTAWISPTPRASNTKIRTLPAILQCRIGRCNIGKKSKPALPPPCPAAPPVHQPPNAQCGGESCARTGPVLGRPQPGSDDPRSNHRRLFEISSSGSPARSGPGLWGRVASLLHKPDRLLAKNRTTHLLPTRCRNCLTQLIFFFTVSTVNATSDAPEPRASNAIADIPPPSFAQVFITITKQEHIELRPVALHTSQAIG